MLICTTSIFSLLCPSADESYRFITRQTYELLTNYAARKCDWERVIASSEKPVPMKSIARMENGVMREAAIICHLDKGVLRVKANATTDWEFSQIRSAEAVTFHCCKGGFGLRTSIECDYLGNSSPHTPSCSRRAMAADRHLGARCLTTFRNEFSNTATASSIATLIAEIPMST